jgi:hypothetical protein
MLLRLASILGVCLLFCSTASAADSKLDGSHRLERDGWIYIRLSGSPERVGYQHGTLLSAEIEDLLRVVKPLLAHTTRRDWEFYRKAAETMLWKHVEPEYQQEIDGIVAGLAAKGVKADRWDLVALNALEELPYYYVPWLDRKEGKTPTSHAPGNCTAFVATGNATKDGKIVMGHNSWTNYIVGARWNIIFDITPARGSRMLMDGLPGVIVSDDDFCVNAAGLMVTETTITQFEGWDPDGKPEFSRARKAMQYGRSVDDFVKIMLDGNNGGYANTWLLGDNTTGEIARFELGLKHHDLARTKDGIYVGANFPINPKLIAEETKFQVSNHTSSPNARKTRWEQLVPQWLGRIDVEAGKKFESDIYDVIDKTEESNDRTLCGRAEVTSRGVPEWDWGPFFPGGTVQAKVIDGTMASKLEFWAAMGNPAGLDFKAEPFLKAHPEYEWARGLLRDMPSRPWSRFSVDMK